MPDVVSALYLGFDFGTKRIGVALGDSVTQHARPLTTLDALNGQPNWDEIAELVENWKPRAFITGFPLTPDGSIGHIAHAAKKFSNRLQARFHRPSHLIDERLTTQIARKISSKSHGTDAIAAAIILEAWLAALPRTS